LGGEYGKTNSIYSVPDYGKDTFFVRTYASSSPTYAMGAEQLAPAVSTTLNFPLASAFMNKSTVVFNWTSSPNKVNFTNTTLYIWDSKGALFNSSFYALSGSSNLTTTKTESLGSGSYIWNAQTCGVGVSCRFGVNRSFTVDTIPPKVDIISPINKVYNTTNLC